ncbi:MAG: cation-efflux pump [Proteobacteria bacterium]|nr:cation-efflux pump [Pseudomonadota bacterium]
MNPSLEKQRVALVSFIASLVLTIVKLAAGLVSGSLSVLSEGLQTLFDCMATAATLFAVREADKPADDTHHYGHAKIESVAALLQSVALFAVTVWIAYQAISRILGVPHEVDVTWWLLAILVGSIIIDWNRSRALQRTADRTGSEALAADALHFRSDMLSSGAVLLGLIVSWLGFPLGDPLAALFVALLIGHAAWELAKKTLATLLDAAPQGVAAVLRSEALSEDGVLSVRQLRVRPAGPTLFIEMAVDVPRTLPVTEIDAIQNRLTDTVLRLHPSADISVNAIPVELDSETALEKVSLIAAEHRAAIHHLMVQDIDGRLAVSFDFEIDGATPLSDAHDRATALEMAIRAGLGDHVEVESHIEPLPQRLLTGKPATSAVQQKVQAALVQLARRHKLLSDLHNVRVRRTEDGLIVHYHCRFAPDVTVDIVHDALDDIENALKAKQKGINRVVAHAEPVGAGQHAL